MQAMFQLPVYGGGYAAPPKQGYGQPSQGYGKPNYGYGHGGYQAPAPHHDEPKNIVCRDLYETVCNTSVLGNWLILF